MKTLKIPKLNIKNLLSLLIIQFFFFQILELSQSFMNFGYPKFILGIKKYLSNIFHISDISVGDIIYFLLGIFLIFSLFKIFIYLILKNKRKVFSSLKSILVIINIMYFWFMISFGLLYNKENFTEYTTSNSSTNLELNDFKNAAQLLLKDCLNIREQLEEDTNGDFLININPLVDYVYSTQKEPLKPCIKISLYSTILSKVGITGYYNPFTNEAQYVSNIPQTEIPFTISHEIGHQIGYAKENEASFYAFLVGENAENLTLQYSVKFKALFYILKDIKNNDPEFVDKIFEIFSEKMKHDYLAKKDYVKQFSKQGRKISHTLNDSYLKANKQDGAITYGYVSKMIVIYYKEKGFR